MVSCASGAALRIVDRIVSRIACTSGENAAMYSSMLCGVTRPVAMMSPGARSYQREEPPGNALRPLLAEARGDCSQQHLWSGEGDDDGREGRHALRHPSPCVMSLHCREAAGDEQHVFVGVRHRCELGRI